MEYLNGYIVSIVLVGAAWLLVIWQLRRRKPKDEALVVEDYEPIQKYSRFPEPARGPTKTVEVRDDKEIPF